MIEDDNKSTMHMDIEVPEECQNINELSDDTNTGSCQGITKEKQIPFKEFNLEIKKSQS